MVDLVYILSHTTSATTKTSAEIADRFVHKYCDISFLSQLWYIKKISGELSKNYQKID